MEIAVIYRKNVFKWEQGLRILAGATAAIVPWPLGLELPLLWSASGIFLTGTGVFGFCPACYMVGRKTPSGSN